MRRARRVIENAFGILAGRWRILSKLIIAELENIEHYTKACILQHNFPISIDKQYAAKGYGNNFGADCSIIERAFKDLPAQTGMNYSLEAKEVRDKFREFFYSDDGNEAAWQETITNHDGYTDPRINYYRPSFLLHLLSSAKYL